MKRPPYPRYKPSGIEWLGAVPEHWEVRRLKDCGELSAGSGFPPEFQGEEGESLQFYKVSDLAAAADGRRMGPAPNTISKSTASHLRACVIPPGAVVYAKIGAALFLNRRRVTTQPCCIDNNMTAFVPDPKRLSTEWSLYWTSILDFAALANPGAVPSLSEGYQATLPAFVPPVAEQRSIVTFLNEQTTKVDRLLGKKRALIERLQEKRAALISRTVTRGLPPEAARVAGLAPHPRLKPSGVDWLGDVPEHWRVVPLKYLALLGNGSTPTRDDAEYWSDGTYPWLNSSVVNQETVTAPSDFVTEAALQGCHLPKIRPPAVLVGITGEGRTRGMATILLIEATISQHLAYLKPLGSRADVRYLRRVLDHAYAFLRSESEGGGSTKGAITCEQLACLRFPAPPIPEQSAVGQYLDRETARLDHMVAKIQAAIDRLQEYRAALITAAVTGKIDVRGAVA